MVLFWSGCSDGNSDNPQNGKVHIQFSTWGSAEEMKVVRSLVGEFEASHPDIHVDILHIPDQYYQKLHILIAGGMVPDVIFTNSIFFPVYASQGIFQDVIPYLNRSPSLKAEHFFLQSLQAFHWKTKGNIEILGAVPRDVSNLVVFYNAELFQKAGLKVPTPSWTWQEFLVSAQKLTVDQNQDGHAEQFGVSFNRTPPMFWLPLVWSSGGDLFSPDFQKFQLNSPQAITALQFYGDWRNRYHIAPRQNESGSATMSQLFLQQKIAMMVSGRWSVPIFREQAKFDWDVVSLPRGEKGSRVGIDASGYALSAQTPHPEAGWALIEFLASRHASEAFTASGLIVPARTDVAESTVFLNPALRPKHSQVFTQVIPDGVPTHTPPRWNEIAETLGLALDPVWDGKTTAQAAVSGLEPAIDKLLPTEGNEW